jgi:aryl sulfotransferase
LEIPIDEAKWGAILEHCSFEYMKSHAAQSAPFGGTIFEAGGRKFMHKGVNGRWRDLLTPEDIEHYERTAKKELGTVCAHWLATGELRND